MANSIALAGLYRHLNSDQPKEWTPNQLCAPLALCHVERSRDISRCSRAKRGVGN